MIKIAALILILLTLPSSLFAEILNITTHEFPPYLCDPAGENGKEGFVVDILRELFEPEGYELRFHRNPYKRGIRMTESGHYDAMPMLNSHSSDILDLAEEPIAVLRQVFYVKKGETWRYTGINSLKTIIVGSIEGYNYSPVSMEYEEYLRNNRDGGRVEYIGGLDATLRNLKKILYGRITTFNECSYLVEYLLQKEGLSDEFTEAGSLLEGLTYNYIGFSPARKDRDRLISIVNRRMARIRDNGRLTEILQSYGLTPWQ